jgi:hypothetical protein
MGINMGSFGSRLIREQRIPDAVWTKVVFDGVDWDTDGGFDTFTGKFVVGQEATFHLAAGVRFLAPDVANRYVDLLLQKNGKPLDMLTRDQAFNRPDSVALDSLEAPWGVYTRESPVVRLSTAPATSSRSMCANPSASRRT